MTTFRQEKTGPTVGAGEPVETKSIAAEAFGHYQPTTHNGLLAEALNYAADGLKVFPCIPTGEKAKRPYIPGGFHNATTDADQIREWWTRWPNALIGHAVDDDKLVFDFDIRNGADQTLFEQKLGCKLPATLTSWSGRNDGGYHLFFWKPDREITQAQIKRLIKGVDLRAGGRGYVIVPPSLHPATGQPYRWDDKAHPVAHLPKQAVDALQPAPKPVAPKTMHYRRGNGLGLVSTVATAPVGERNRTLFWAACRAFDNGDEPTLQGIYNAALQNGLPEDEVQRTIRSAEDTPRQQPNPRFCNNSRGRDAA